jgi:hypothetical protein
MKTIHINGDWTALFGTINGKFQKLGKKSQYSKGNENTNYQNLCDAAKVVLRGKFIFMSACTEITKKSQISDLILHSQGPI